MDKQSKTARDRVKAAYPSARSESRGLTFVAILAIERDPDTHRITRDHFFGSGKTEKAAWEQAAGQIEEDVANG